jgi:hypothetical protein
MEGGSPCVKRQTIRIRSTTCQCVSCYQHDAMNGKVDKLVGDDPSWTKLGVMRASFCALGLTAASRVTRALFLRYVASHYPMKDIWLPSSSSSAKCCSKLV